MKSSPLPVIAIFDVGKTNKKILLLDEDYSIRWEHSVKLAEIPDDDGFPCENVDALAGWVKNTFDELRAMPEYEIRAVNFSAYGASFVHINEQNIAFLPLYNYLKPYPRELQDQFYTTYGGQDNFTLETASPVLGSLNSGMQLYRLKYEKPEQFNSIKFSLHLPQYLCFLISEKACSEITSIGCHTNLLNFRNVQYHDWVYKEQIHKVLAPVYSGANLANVKQKVMVGVGLHDSSAAMIPYLINFSDPFVLISTGTWCITLNPFNKSPLTEDELKNDCLFYMSYTGSPVKASRLFAGYEHEQQIRRLAEYFNKPEDYYASIVFDAGIYSSLVPGPEGDIVLSHTSPFALRDLSSFQNYEQAYHQLIADIISMQTLSTQLVLNGTNAHRIFVDGGFSKNQVYMSLLSAAFPQYEVYAASVSQASAIGAALAIHEYWNNKALPSDIIELKKYS